MPDFLGFQFGVPGVSSVTSAPAPVPSSGTVWGTLGFNLASSWVEAGMINIPKFEHIYAEPVGPAPTYLVPFVYEITSNYPWIVQTGTNVLIVSQFTTVV
jgi:hypothetical protein